MKGNCETCRHWVVHHKPTWGDCAFAEIGRDGVKHRRSLAHAWSASYVGAGLTTHCTFGCFQWEEKV